MKGATWTIAVATCALLTGCAGSGNPQVIEGVAGEIILVASEVTGLEALVTGTLAMGEGGCLVLEPSEPIDGSDGPRPVVWPPGTKVLDAPSGGVALPSGTDIAIGDFVELGGGSIDASMDFIPEIPERCAADDGMVTVISSE